MPTPKPAYELCVRRYRYDAGRGTREQQPGTCDAPGELFEDAGDVSEGEG